MNVPKYINNRGNIVRLVSLTALFALVFINIYKPFSSENWYKVSNFMFFVYSSLIILTGVLVVIISRIIMYFYSKKHDISYLQYGVWVTFEIASMSLFYTIYTMSVNTGRDWWEVFKSSTINTALVLLLPYGILTLYLAWRENQKTLAKIENGELVDSSAGSGKINFIDDKGVLRFSVTLDNLLYIESSDNYVIIHYNNLGKIKSYLLRNTLKTIETALEKTPIGRCHRSFLVNFSRVKVLRKTKDGIILELDVDIAPEIPVSKSYQEKISQKFLGNL